MPGPPRRCSRGRTWGAAVSEAEATKAKERRLALAKVLLLPRIGYPAPPAPPPPPPGMTSYYALRHLLLVAAFGDAISKDAFNSVRQEERLRKALDNYKAAASERLGLRPRVLGGCSPWDEYSRPASARGLFGQYSLSPRPPMSHAEEQRRRKAARADRYLVHLASRRQERFARLMSALDHVDQFIRILGIQGELNAYTVSIAGSAHVRPRAWKDEENWQRLRAEKVFRAADPDFTEPGHPWFPIPEVEALMAFVAKTGQGGLGDIRGAVRALNGTISDPEHLWPSAYSWFHHGGGRQEAEAKLMARDEIVGVLATKREGAAIWNTMPEMYKAPGAKRLVKPEAFKERPAKRGARA